MSGAQEEVSFNMRPNGDTESEKGGGCKGRGARIPLRSSAFLPLLHLGSIGKFDLRTGAGWRACCQIRPASLVQLIFLKKNKQNRSYR